jgi:hypothetical protein
LEKSGAWCDEQGIMIDSRLTGEKICEHGALFAGKIALHISLSLSSMLELFFDVGTTVVKPENALFGLCLQVLGCKDDGR